MANRPAPALVLREGDCEALSRLTRSSSVRAGLAQRARIVLLGAHGLSNAEIARRVGVSGPTVLCWRNRYLRGGLAALEDAPRSGRPPVHDELAVVGGHAGATRGRRGSPRITGSWSIRSPRIARLGRAVERQVMNGREHVIADRSFDSIAELDAAFKAWLPIRLADSSHSRGGDRRPWTDLPGGAAAAVVQWR